MVYRLCAIWCECPFCGVDLCPIICQRVYYFQVRVYYNEGLVFRATNRPSMVRNEFGLSVDVIRWRWVSPLGKRQRQIRANDDRDTRFAIRIGGVCMCAGVKRLHRPSFPSALYVICLKYIQHVRTRICISVIKIAARVGEWFLDRMLLGSGLELLLRCASAEDQHIE